MSKKPYFVMYRAQGWGNANGNKATERQPHLFYRCEDVDAGLDAIADKHAFERRKWKALEAFYLNELGRALREDT